MTAGDRDYVQRLGEVLRQRDPEALRGFLVEQAGRFGDERQVTDVRDKPADELSGLLHRMILARSDLADLHPASRRWLSEHDAGPDPGPQPDRAGPRGARYQTRRSGGRPHGDAGEAQGDDDTRHDDTRHDGNLHGHRPRGERSPRRSDRPRGPRDSGDGGAHRSS
ncbi:MAG: hypothetical protein IT305_20260 [Chloroflexi bacterium]|nr:hypothetical protein [Chloroflexota bacterium]